MEILHVYCAEQVEAGVALSLQKLAGIQSELGHCNCNTAGLPLPLSVSLSLSL
jgi:hypothetical protein